MAPRPAPSDLTLREHSPFPTPSSPDLGLLPTILYLHPVQTWELCVPTLLTRMFLPLEEKEGGFPLHPSIWDLNPVTSTCFLFVSLSRPPPWHHPNTHWLGAEVHGIPSLLKAESLPH